MATNTERDELHKTIWAIANDLRGAIDGWSFKAYVLGAIFYRYISENITNYINELQMAAMDSGSEEMVSNQFAELAFDYAKMDDEEAEEAREMIVAEKGYFILPSQLFCNVVENCEKDENLNETLSKIFRAIEASAQGTASEDAMRGLFSDFVVDNSQLGSSVAMRNQLLAKVLIRVRDMALGGDYNDREIDTFGDTYEFLMQMYAANAGKSGGEFFTPQEVSELLASLASHNNDNIKMVYDPACGSGSLLLKFKKVVDPDNEKGLQYFGQEINPTTYNLCRINMFLHDINFANFDIELGDTLISPQHLGMEFDAIVSNPPYSIGWAGKSNPLLINDERYAPAGVLAPESKADLAFTMHMLHHLNESGTCAIVEFPGVLYRGGDEQKIRKYLIDNNYVDTVIQLPQNLFFGVSIATCILVLKKSAKTDSNILFIDASEVFHKVGNKNKLYEEDQKKIFDAYKDRKDIQYFTKLVSNDEVLANACNLSVSSYVEQEDKREKIVIEDVNSELSKLCAKGIELRNAIDAIVKELEG